MMHGVNQEFRRSVDVGQHIGVELEEAQVQARAAWYYYVGGLTQQEVADRLGITRLRVNRIIGQARADGLVHIDIRLPLSSCVELEQRLVARYGLHAASVVPSVDDELVQTQIIGEASGVLLQPLLYDGIRLGIGYGGSLRAAVRRLKGVRMPKSRIIALMGGLVTGSELNSFEVCGEFVRQLGGSCAYITAPIYCPTAEARAALIDHGGIADALAEARKSDIALISCGSIDNNAVLDHHDSFSRHRADLKAAGAVGSILGTFVNDRGDVVDHSLNACVMALTLNELKSIPRRILLTNGLKKLAVTRAALNARLVDTLVTDESVAQALLAV
jgi:DNA-binding transcriptional regulator LsrR (DeoR family)